MRFFFSNKVLRFLLSASVSVWMAGGCLFGCSKTAMAADATPDETVMKSGESCHARAKHDCCTKGKPKKKQAAKTLPPLSGATTLLPTSRGQMTDCPLMASATAAAAKGSTNLPGPGSAPVTDLPSFEKQTVYLDHSPIVPFLPNRGPTHLRCCVFLI